MKILKFLLFGLGSLVLLIAAAAAYVAATFDPNQYKKQIVKAVKEKTQRDLKLEGDIKLAFFPSIGASLGKAALSERTGDKEFAAVQDLRVAVKLVPLLSRQVVVDAVEIRGLRAELVRFKNGKTNADDLAGDSGPAPGAKPAETPFRIDIARVLIEDAALTITDEAAGAKYALSKLNLKTGRIASGVPTDVELSLSAQADKPKLDLETTLKARLTHDLDQQSYALEDLDLRASGQAADLSDLALKASGSVSAKLKAGEFAAQKLAVAATGASGQNRFDLKLDAPRLTFTSAKASGDKVSLAAKISGPQRSINANLSLAGVEGTAQAFSSAGMALELDARQGDQDIKAKLVSPLAGNLEAQQLSLPKLIATLAVTGPGFPGKGLSAELRGSASVDGRKEAATADLVGKLAESNVNAKLRVANFKAPAIAFDADVDQVDVNRYRQPAVAARSPSGDAQSAAEKPFDLAGLRNLRANGTLRVGALKVANLKAVKIRLDVGAANGRVNVNPMTASLYQGTLNGAVSLDAAGATPVFAVKQTLSGVSVGPLLKDLADNDTLEGKGNVSIDVTSRGNTTAALKKALDGSAAVKLADGAMKGINIAGAIRNAKAKLGALKGEQVQQADKAEKTDFSELVATFSIKNGVAHNNDLSMKSPLLRVGGEGDVNIGEDKLDYLVKASIVGTGKGQGGRELAELQGVTVPVRVSGPLAAPTYKLDFNSIATEAVKQKIAETVKGKLGERLARGTPKDEKKAGSQGGSLRDNIKGLFGR